MKSNNANLLFSTVITSAERNQQLLTLLSSRFPYHTAEEWKTHIDQGRIKLNNKTASADSLLSTGDTLSYSPESYSEPEVPTDLEIIKRSRDFLILGKPAGTPVSRTGIIINNTFINIVRRKFKNRDIHLMHRLDRETSGILLCATSKAVCREYQKNIGDILTDKFYLAIVRGKLDVENQMVDLPLAQSKTSAIRCGVAVDPTGKPSQTVISTVAASEKKSLLLVKLITGRKHQIRCHLAHLGHPVIGDKIYDHHGKYYLKRVQQELDAEDYRILGAKNHTLHAWAANISFPGESRRLYRSKCFSDDFMQHVESFPDWESICLERLSRLTPLQHTQTG